MSPMRTSRLPQLYPPWRKSERIHPAIPHIIHRDNPIKLTTSRRSIWAVYSKDCGMTSALKQSWNILSRGLISNHSLSWISYVISQLEDRFVNNPAHSNALGLLYLLPRKCVRVESDGILPTELAPDLYQEDIPHSVMLSTEYNVGYEVEATTLSHAVLTSPTSW